jgi:hypothetical protein
MRIEHGDFNRLIGRVGDIGPSIYEKASNEDELKKRLAHAKAMYGKARRRLDAKGMGWWKKVYHHTKKALKDGGEGGGKGASKGGASAASGGGGGGGEEHQSFLKALTTKSKEAAAAFKKLPKASKRFFSDPSYRKKAAKSIAGKMRKTAAGAVEHVKEEIHEFKDAGKAVLKLTKGEKISGHEKEVMKKAAKAIAMTVIGTAAFGGLGHLTLGAMAKHFAAETAVKAVAKAAVMSHLMYNGIPFLTEEEMDEKVLETWVKSLVNHIADEIEKIADMDEDEIAALLEKVA